MLVGVCGGIREYLVSFLDGICFCWGGCLSDFNGLNVLFSSKLNSLLNHYIVYMYIYIYIHTYLYVYIYIHTRMHDHIEVVVAFLFVNFFMLLS